MKVIDLLNKIANGEEFKKVEIEYFDNNNLCRDKCYLKENEIIYRLYYGNLELNDKVEILEEEKKIPEKLNWVDYNIEFTQKKFNKEFRNICNAVDEIIDYLNSKGE